MDLIYSGTVNRLKYQFVVNPGADPAVIRLAYRGADVRLNGAGQLEVSTPVGGFRDDKPYVFQERGGRRVAIPAAYSVDAAASEERVRYGFALGEYDASRVLIIDPSVLIYAGYIGGTALDRGADVAVDSAGNAYVTGETAGTAGFPALAGPDLTFNGDTDAFVAKVNAAGTGLVYAGLPQPMSSWWGTSVLPAPWNSFSTTRSSRAQPPPTSSGTSAPAVSV